MNEPSHEQIHLRATERAEFIAITQQLGSPPRNPAMSSALGWRNRARIVFFTHLVAAAFLLPLGLAAMSAAIVVWWPLGLAGAGLVIIGQYAIFELVRTRRQRRQITIGPTERTT